MLRKPQSRDTSLPSGPSTTCVSSLPVVSVYTEIGRTHSTYRRIPVSGHRCCASCCATHSPSHLTAPVAPSFPPAPTPSLSLPLCVSLSLSSRPRITSGSRLRLLRLSLANLLALHSRLKSWPSCRSLLYKSLLDRVLLSQPGLPC